MCEQTSIPWLWFLFSISTNFCGCYNFLKHWKPILRSELSTSQCEMRPLKGGFILQTWGTQAVNVQVESSWRVWHWLVLHDGGVIQACLWEGDFVQTFSPSFPSLVLCLSPSPLLPPSGVDEVRDHISGVWPSVCLILPLSLAFTHRCTTAYPLCLFFPLPACRYKYKESKASCFSVIYSISASLGMLLFARHLVYACKRVSLYFH